MNHESTHETAPTGQVTDVSGYVVFSHGDEGAAHVSAHRMLDDGQFALGHAQLGAWLDGRTGSGSDWTHLHFHMAIFELGVDDWHAAYARFLREILPVAATTEDALTDAPGMLWRIAMTAPESVKLPWQALRQTALSSMRGLRTPFVELHHLLTFAGARDRDGIDSWIRTRATQIHSQRDWLVVQAGRALRAYVDGAYATAAIELERLAPQMPIVGGSRAQNELFADLASYSWRCARNSGQVTSLAGTA